MSEKESRRVVNAIAQSFGELDDRIREAEQEIVDWQLWEQSQGRPTGPIIREVQEISGGPYIMWYIPV